MAEHKRTRRIAHIIGNGERIVDMALNHVENDFESRMARLLQEKLGKNAQPLSLRECHVLQTVFEGENLKASEISEQLNLTRGGMSKILARLEKKGYLQIAPKEGNKKERALFLTSDGVAAVRIHEKLHCREHEKWKMLLERYDDDKLLFLEDLTAAIIEAEGEPSS